MRSCSLPSLALHAGAAPMPWAPCRGADRDSIAIHDASPLRQRAMHASSCRGLQKRPQAATPPSPRRAAQPVRRSGQPGPGRAGGGMRLEVNAQWSCSLYAGCTLPYTYAAGRKRASGSDRPAQLLPVCGVHPTLHLIGRAQARAWR